MFGVGTCPVIGTLVRCTCSALGVPTAASGHMQSCPMYTPPAQVTTVSTSSVAACTAAMNGDFDWQALMVLRRYGEY